MLRVVDIDLVSSDVNGEEGSAPSFVPGFASGSDFVVFNTDTPNFVDGDTNGLRDVFLKNFVTGEISIVSVGSAGEQGNFTSLTALKNFVSDDGEWVVFNTRSTTLGPNDTNSFSDIYLKNTQTGVLTLVSHDLAGNSGNGETENAQLFADGSKLVFNSLASNLVAGDTNNANDVFLHDVATGLNTRISTTQLGVAGNGFSIQPIFSADGNKVLFSSTSNNFYAGDTNNRADLFVKNLLTGELTTVSVRADGVIGNEGSFRGNFSPDGTKVVFESSANNFVAGDIGISSDLFIKDLVTGALTLVSSASNGTKGNISSQSGQFSPNGNYILFESSASNLIAGDTNFREDLFLKNIATGETTLVSQTQAGVVGNAGSRSGSFSVDGTKIIFESQATNFAAGSTNGATNIFIKDLITGELTLVTQGLDGLPINGISGFASFHADGDRVVFYSTANNLADGDTNAAQDIFVATLAEDMTISGGDDADSLDGGAAWDSINGFKGNDTINGHGGNDELTGWTGNDELNGGAGNDSLLGGSGDDTMHGGEGDDYLSGYHGSDWLFGDAGNDKLIGGDDADHINGGLGRDTMTGNAGEDTFVFDDASASVFNNADRIQDFEVGIDKLDVSALGYTNVVLSGAQEGELRLAYSASSDRTYVRDDYSDFEFFLEHGDYRNTLTVDDFIFAAPDLA